jgi:hypothetical protein
MLPYRAPRARIDTQSAAFARLGLRRRQDGRVVTIDDVRGVARELPRSYEALVRGRVKFRVGQIVYLAFSPDEEIMGFAFPKIEREALVAGEPEKFLMPTGGDLRYQWVLVRLAELDRDEMRELVLDAWAMVVPKRVSADYFASIGIEPDPGG